MGDDGARGAMGRDPGADPLFFGILALVMAGMPVAYVAKIQVFSLLGVPYGHPVEMAVSLVLAAAGAALPVIVVVRVPILPIRVGVLLLTVVFFGNHAATILGLPSLYTPLFAEQFVFFEF